MRARLDLLYAALTVLWLAVLVVEVVRRNRGGRVLFDLGVSRNAGIYTGMGLLMLVIGVGFSSLSPFRGAYHIFWGVWLLLIGRRRVQIREAGILAKRRLIRWSELLGFSLEPDGILRLRMQTPEGKIIGCAIPSADRQTISHILSLRLPLLPTS